MYSIGDRVVYPMHGVGVIESVEVQTVLGEECSYYSLRIVSSGMKVLVPVEWASQSGLRMVSDEETVNQVIETLSLQSTDMPDNWNRRNRENLEKLKTGNLFYIAEVVRNLLRMDKNKKLSAGEKKMLTNARDLLSGEVAFAKNIEKEQADQIIVEAVGV